MQILLTVSYDGTDYAGWQRQKNAVAVQQRLEEGLSALLKMPISVQAASRTDAGVHALGQRASFFVDDISVPINKLPLVLSGFLPRDICVTDAIIVPDNFNPRFDAAYKTYAYNMHSTPNPLLNRYSVYVPRPLDIDAMQKAAKAFVGEHDFATFMATGGGAKTTIREIHACGITTEPGGKIVLTITGGGFLYNMVRIIAGTLMYIGLGKIPAEAIQDIILSRDRTKAGKTMPPEGLVLVEVGYIAVPV